MADLDKTGISTGEDVEATDITKLYDALTGDTVYDNVPTLLGNIKELALYTVVVDSSNWTTTILKNTTGASAVVVNLPDQDNQENIGIGFTGYTLPVIGKMLVYVQMGPGFVSETGEQVWFIPDRHSDTYLHLKMYDSGFSAFNHAGSDLAEDSDLYIRILFYP